jgi:beta-galactosidase
VSNILRIDSGYTSTAPPSGWVADVDFSGAGSTGSVTHAITIPSSVSPAAPAAVYQTYRKGSSFTYAVPNLTPGGSYVVDLHFSENFFATAGSREFNVAINGTQVLTNFDIYATAGGEYTATIQSFYATADATGTITIAFTTGAVNSPQVNGIQIGTGTVSVPSAPSSLTAQTISKSQIVLNWGASSGSNLQYEVFRSTNPAFTPSPATLITTTLSTSYNDIGLMAGTTYFYLVEANNSLLTSLPSNQASTETSPLPAQSISFPTLPSQVTYGATPLTLAATASSGLAVSYSITGPANLSGSTLSFTGAGSVVVTAIQPGDGSTYGAATAVAQTIAVNPATLTVAANNASMNAGSTPALTYSYSGFVHGDTATVLTGSPTESTTATSSSPAGLYPIVIGQGTLAASNYTFNFASGTLSVLSAPTITLTTTATLSKVSGGYQATVTVKNTGNAAASNVQLTSASLGSAAGTPLPLSLGAIAGNGGAASVVVTFPSTAGNDGSSTVEKYSGTYSGGTFTASIRAVLP